MKLIRIRMYCGGRDGYQASNFMPGVSEFIKKFSQTVKERHWEVSLEVKYASDIRSEWTPRMLVDWLEEGASSQLMCIKVCRIGMLGMLQSSCNVFTDIQVSQTASICAVQYFCSINFIIYWASDNM